MYMMVVIMKEAVFLTMSLLVFSMTTGCEKNPSATVSKPETPSVAQQSAEEPKMDDTTAKMPQTNAEWKSRLTDEQYFVLRKKGTERPFTGKYDKFYEPGTYKCAGCGNVIFVSDDKYNSGCGWPAFSAPADESAVRERRDLSHGMNRTEITCSKCGGHLGHVFNDGPAPTGQRYCINSAALEFEEQKP